MKTIWIVVGVGILNLLLFFFLDSVFRSINLLIAYVLLLYLIRMWVEREKVPNKNENDETKQ